MKLYCDKCGKDLNIVIGGEKPKKVLCERCAALEQREGEPHPTAIKPRAEVLAMYKKFIKDTENEIREEMKRDYYFEQPYWLQGRQGSLNDYRNIVFWIEHDKDDEPGIVG